MPGNLDSRRARLKNALRRCRVEIVRPPLGGAAHIRHTRIRRFELPEEVEATRGDAGPDTFVIDVDRSMNRARFGYGAKSWHPFVAALEEQLETGGLPYEKSLLAAFYEQFQPATIHDTLLGEDVPRRVLADWPAVNGLLDVWSATDRYVRRLTTKEAATDEPWPSQYRGPDVVPYGEDHLERVVRIHESMRDTGYRPYDFADGLATGYFLIEGDDYRFVVGHGNHQLTAVTVLGIPRVPVKLRYQHPPVITRGDLPRWTVAAGGLYSPAEADALFDSYFRDDGVTRARHLGLA